MKDVSLFFIALVLAGWTVWGQKLGYSPDHAITLTIGIACFYRTAMVMPEILVMYFMQPRQPRDATLE